MARSKVSKTAAKVISDAIYDTLKNRNTPTERAVLNNLNSNLIKQWDLGNISLENSNIITDCFERERAETTEA